MARRIAVIGTTGSGKTTIARQVAAVLSVPAVELDALYWEPGWVEVDSEVFRNRAKEALRGDSWVVDGNYRELRDITWGRADTVIWLDYPLHVILRRLVPRCIKRAYTGEKLWNGNRETWRSLLGRDSLILYAVNSHGRQWKAYPEALALPEYSHLKVLQFKNPGETERWLRSLKATL